MKLRKVQDKGAIKLHRDELKDVGIKMSGMSCLVKTVHTAHRDVHYMSIIQQEGRFLWKLDFKEVLLEGPAVCYVSPGQVHRYIDFNDSTGWPVFVETELIAAKPQTVGNLLKCGPIG